MVSCFLLWTRYELCDVFFFNSVKFITYSDATICPQVIQRRQDGSVDFYRTYEEYAEGFGNNTGEFWIGESFSLSFLVFFLSIFPIRDCCTTPEVSTRQVHCDVGFMCLHVSLVCSCRIDHYPNAVYLLMEIFLSLETLRCSIKTALVSGHCQN